MLVYRKSRRLADGTVKVYPHWWYKFMRDGQSIERNTKQGNKRTAQELEAQHRTSLARGEAGLTVGKIPTLKQFEPKFTVWVQQDISKENTRTFYADCVRRLLDFPALANARLSDIDRELIDRYRQARQSLAVSTRNSDLATLHKLLEFASTEKVIPRAPKIKKEIGTVQRDFVLTRADQPAYLAACPDPLADCAALILETGLRLGEALALTWDDIHLEPSAGKRYGWLQVREGKTVNAARAVSLTPAAADVLRRRKATSASPWIFPNESETGPALVNSVGHQHARVRELLKLDPGFVVHSLRHTMLTRLGEAGADVFTIKKIAGHASIKTSERYVHPSSDAMEAAFDRLTREQVATRRKGRSPKSSQAVVKKGRARSSAG